MGFHRRNFLAIGAAALFAPRNVLAAEAETTELEKIRALFETKAPVTWLLTGDSITHGALHTFGWRSYPEHFSERVRWEMGRVRDIVINTGISGDRVPGLLKDLDHRVLRFEPTVVSVMMGMNDATDGEAGREPFRKAYHQLIQRLRDESEALILLHTPNPITEAATSRADLPAYAQIIREVAEAEKVALVDQDRMWREWLKEKNKALISLIQDGTIHPNNAGHLLFTHNLCEVLGIHDPDSNVGKLDLF